ncbi:MAG TPA: hypothetical protein VFJ58_14405 [Armatimonadota bacterium]|nr:hypothetical protein [Armatimonadota bacterium]
MYLAVSSATYQGLLNDVDGRDLIKAESIRLLVLEPDKEIITQWID